MGPEYRRMGPPVGPHRPIGSHPIQQFPAFSRTKRRFRSNPAGCTRLILRTWGFPLVRRVRVFLSRRFVR
jgi:hypothetical protein